ncbi:MAG: deoxyribonuclease [Legionellales bacterium RIFCSPHIGHO2_12_FULL_35_11]|nr:MAG: deoxyribonuclease [Legionellales bacterium RIFCSPHIGHO2_12_FULL_35_11]
MLVDSHCHLNMLNLDEFDNNLANVLAKAKENGVTYMLCVCVELSDLPALHEIANKYENIAISVGVHPNTELEVEPSAEYLIELGSSKKCIAIGETGLDYYRSEGEQIIQKQHQRFINHIQASIELKKPLIIHTRQAAEDTLKIMKKENAYEIGGVMHCFAEDWDIAKRALDLNFYISFSGIVSFKNATNLHEVAKMVPLDRMLIETDSPYLAPVPFRGKQNHPALVKHVASAIAELRGIEFSEVALKTTENFYKCFRVSRAI